MKPEDMAGITIEFKELSADDPFRKRGRYVVYAQTTINGKHYDWGTILDEFAANHIGDVIVQAIGAFKRSRKKETSNG